MNKRINKTLFLFSSILSIFIIILTTGLIYYYFSNQQLNDLKTQMTYLVPGVEDSGEKYLKSLDVPDRITLINKNGNVIFDNYSEQLDNHLNREEVKQAIENGEAESVRYSQTLGEKTVYYAKKLKSGDILRISTTRSTIFYLFTGFLQIYLIIIIGILIISYFIAKALTKSLVEPIDKINPEKPELNYSYPELNPLLNKIYDQNEEITQQLNKVKNQKADFETVTHNMSEGIITIKNSGKFKSINESARELLSISNLKPGDFYNDLEELDLVKLITSALNGNKEELTLTKNNRILNIIASPINVSEKQRGCVLIIIDITEKAQRERLRSEYVSNVSHELKTPLTSISGFAEIIKTGLVKEEDIPYFASKIYDETQLLITTVNDILTISHLDEKNYRFKKSEVSLIEITKKVFERLSGKINEKHLNFKLITIGNCIIYGNYQILEELIYNLVDNAIKYNKSNGKIRVVLNGKNPNSVVLKVIDSGIGISMEDQQRIFERFYRNDESRSLLIEGTGLGLSIVKHAATVHNAEVSVKSKKDHGSSFEIIFPKNTDEPE